MANITNHLKTAFPLGKLSRNARLFLVAAMIDGIINSTWSLYFNFFVLSRGYDKQFMGLANAMPSIATLLVGLPMGMLSDRIGRRKAMLLGLIMLSAGYGMMAIAPSQALILVAGFLGGAGSALYFNSQAPFMMNASTAETRTLLFSLSSGIVTLSGALGNLVAGKLPQLLSSITGLERDGSGVLQIIMLAAVAFGTLSLIPIALIREDKPTAHHESTGSPSGNLKGLIRKPVLWMIFLPNMLTGIGAGILMPYVNLFYAERFTLTDVQLGVLFSLSSLLTGAASLIGPRLAVILRGKVRTVVITQGLSFGFLVLMGFTPLGWLSQFSYLVRTMLMNMATPLFSAFAMEQFLPGEQGKANSIFGIAWTLGWAFGPYVSGIVQVHSGFAPLFVATTALYAGATSLIWLFFGRQERKEALSLANAARELEG
jgi:MFS family permease